MKKRNLIFCLLILLSVTQVWAQEEKPETKIFNLLNSELTLTPDQTPKAQSLVGDFTKQFAELSKKQMLSSLKQKAQEVLFNKFSGGLGKLLTPAQLTKFNAIKNTVKNALAGLK